AEIDHPDGVGRFWSGVGPLEWGAKVEDLNNVLLIHSDGADASTVFTDATARHTITANGNAQVDTAQSLFGGASLLLDGTGDYLEIFAQPGDFAFNTNDFTVECFFRPNASVTDMSMVSGRGPLNSDWVLAINSTDIRWGRNNVGWDAISTTPLTWSTGVWYHLAVSRQDGVLRLFVNGVKVCEQANTISYSLNN